MISAFIRDESAATSIEYGLIAMVVSVGIIVSLQYFTDSLDNLFSYTSDSVTSKL